MSLTILRCLCSFNIFILLLLRWLVYLCTLSLSFLRISQSSSSWCALQSCPSWSSLLKHCFLIAISFRSILFVPFSSLLVITAPCCLLLRNFSLIPTHSSLTTPRPSFLYSMFSTLYASSCIQTYSKTLIITIHSILTSIIFLTLIILFMRIWMYFLLFLLSL